MLWRLLIGDVVWRAAVTTTMLQGIALLYGIFMDSAVLANGDGRALFAAVVARASALIKYQ